MHAIVVAALQGVADMTFLIINLTSLSVETVKEMRKECKEDGGMKDRHT